MGRSRSKISLAISLSVLVAVTGCSSSGGSDESRGGNAGGTVTPSASSTTTPTAQAASDADRVAEFCAANAAAGRAVQGTVAEDIEARQAQADSTRMLLPVPGASAQVTAGAEKFAAAADETVAILRDFPPESMVSDVGTDPKFLQSSALEALTSDEEYRAFLGWVLETCTTM